MRWQQLKREYEERTGEPWPGFGEAERRRLSSERSQEGVRDERTQKGSVSPIFSRKRRRPWK